MMSFHRRRAVVRLCVACLLIAAPVAGQAAAPVAGQTAAPVAGPAAASPPSTSLLKDLNASVEALTRRVSLSVVQVLVTSYGPVDDASHTADTGLVIGRQRSIGSGAIIDAAGYIITNAHVVEGARQVQVVLHRDSTHAGPVGSLATDDGLTVDARIVGVASDIDLALLKVEVTGLPALPLANYDAIRQGEIVFAFGSPEGLRNSITMGVVSAVARQPDPDSPAFYIQTDAPINRGNSGGPLVNVNGELVGLNTFILTESGGSQGLGFAIPSAIVGAVYPQLRKYGHLHRGQVGFNTQALTPALAAGLGLSRSSGVVVSDVLPGGSADASGVQVKDIIMTVNGKRVSSVAMLALELSRYAAGDVVVFEVLRGTTPMRSRFRSRNARTRSTGSPTWRIPKRGLFHGSGLSAWTSRNPRWRCCLNCACRPASLSWPVRRCPPATTCHSWPAM